MLRRIVVPLDQSTISESALPLARALAKQNNLSVSLLTVFDPPDPLPDPEVSGIVTNPSIEPWDDQRAMRGSLPFGPGAAPAPVSGSDLDEISSKASEAADYLGRIAETFRGITVQTTVQYGSPVEHIHHLATVSSRAEEPDPGVDAVVVMASHGRSGLGRALLGSVAWQVVQGARYPVFLVRGADNEDAAESHYDLSRVVIALDGSPFAEQVIPTVQHWLGNSVREVRLVRVVDSHRSWVTGEPEARDPEGRSERDQAEQYLSTFADRLTARGYAVDWEVCEGDVADRINDVAGACDANLIALATHGRSGLSRLSVGSVAEQVLHHSTRPLLVVRPEEVE